MISPFTLSTFHKNMDLADILCIAKNIKELCNDPIELFTNHFQTEIEKLVKIADYLITFCEQNNCNVANSNSITRSNMNGILVVSFMGAFIISEPEDRLKYLYFINSGNKDDISELSTEEYRKNFILYKQLILFSTFRLMHSNYIHSIDTSAKEYRYICEGLKDMNKKGNKSVTPYYLLNILKYNNLNDLYVDMHLFDKDQTKSTRYLHPFGSSIKYALSSEPQYSDQELYLINTSNSVESIGNKHTKSYDYNLKVPTETNSHNYINYEQEHNDFNQDISTSQSNKLYWIGQPRKEDRVANFLQKKHGQEKQRAIANRKRMLRCDASLASSPDITALLSELQHNTDKKKQDAGLIIMLSLLLGKRITKLPELKKNFIYNKAIRTFEYTYHLDLKNLN